MSDLSAISSALVFTTIILSLVAIGAIVIAAQTGSLTRYKQQRDEHFKQYNRIREELSKERR